MEISEDQNKIKLDDGRELSFIACEDEEMKNKVLMPCIGCEIRSIPDIRCRKIPCFRDMRRDGKIGYFKLKRDEL
jgi:hypothetical protein